MVSLPFSVGARGRVPLFLYALPGAPGGSPPLEENEGMQIGPEVGRIPKGIGMG